MMEMVVFNGGFAAVKSNMSPFSSPSVFSSFSSVVRSSNSILAVGHKKKKDILRTGDDERHGVLFIWRTELHTHTWTRKGKNCLKAKELYNTDPCSTFYLACLPTYCQAGLGREELRMNGGGREIGDILIRESRE